MKKELKDYIFLYGLNGIDAIRKKDYEIAKNDRRHFCTSKKAFHTFPPQQYQGKEFITTCFGDPQGTYDQENIDNILLILRPLSEMTNEEMKELKWDSQELKHAISQKRHPNFYNTEFLYLLKKGFDLFGLIDDGLALPHTQAA